MGSPRRPDPRDVARRHRSLDGGGRGARRRHVAPYWRRLRPAPPSAARECSTTRRASARAAEVASSDRPSIAPASWRIRMRAKASMRLTKSASAFCGSGTSVRGVSRRTGEVDQTVLLAQGSQRRDATELAGPLLRIEPCQGGKKRRMKRLHRLAVGLLGPAQHGSGCAFRPRPSQVAGRADEDGPALGQARGGHGGPESAPGLLRTSGGQVEPAKAANGPGAAFRVSVAIRASSLRWRSAASSWRSVGAGHRAVMPYR